MSFDSSCNAGHDQVVHLFSGTAVISGQQTQQGSNFQSHRQGSMSEIVLNKLLDHSLRKKFHVNKSISTPSEDDKWKLHP